jgi:hypothetical protein
MESLNGVLPLRAGAKFYTLAFDPTFASFLLVEASPLKRRFRRLVNLTKQPQHLLITKLIAT